MKFLVLYSTIEGHTHKVAGSISKTIEEMGHEVYLTETVDPGYCDPGEFDGAIFAAPIHIGRYPSDFIAYVQNWKSSLAEIPDALVTVSLAIASDNAEERAEAEQYPIKLIEKTGWKPDKLHDAAGALKYVEYDFFKRWIMRRIAEKEGGPTDTSMDHELTNWNALKAFVEEFVSEVAADKLTKKAS